MSAGPVVLRDLGLVPYGEALALQRELQQAKRVGTEEDDVLILLEHPPVVTIGRSSGKDHVLFDPAAGEGIEVVEIERGGDVTYHGPGQLVAYPILDLTRHRKDLHWYLRGLEEVVILTLASLGISAFRVEGLTGVWVGDGDPPPSGDRVPELVRAGGLRKIASIGVHASRWITIHGLALNHLKNSLEGFASIVPCGIADVTMTSIESEGVAVSRTDLKRSVVSAFETVFEVRVHSPAANPS